MSSAANMSNSEANKKCPFCAELIQQEAVFCRYCQKDLPALKIEKTKKFFSFSNPKFVIPFGLLIFFVVLANLSKPSSTIEQRAMTIQEDQAIQNVEKPRVEKEYIAGEDVTVGSFTYNIGKNGWNDRLSDNQYLNKAPNALYLGVFVSVKNVDNQARTIPPFQLVDESGATYDTTPNAMVIENVISFLDQINPGVSKKGYAVFDVPPEKHYKLIISGGYWSSDRAIVKLEILAPKRSRK